MLYLSVKKDEWDKRIEELLLSYTIFATIKDEYGLDYELLKAEDIQRISYNEPKPVTPLKSLFLPQRENVTAGTVPSQPRIIIGVPSCDAEALGLLDEIYINSDFEDFSYRSRRESTIIISADCLTAKDHCHCLSYGIRPFSTSAADIAVISLDDLMIIRVIEGKEEKCKELFPRASVLEDDKTLSEIDNRLAATMQLLVAANTRLPDYRTTGLKVRGTGEKIWKKFSSRCVSCGACSAICPTCTCFLLIDRPGFEKIKQNDTCQYPGFARVAGGEDPLFELHNRFRNRYMCKYAWKPEKFRSIACTGCGRCIEACPGKINKNELFRELAG